MDTGSACCAEQKNQRSHPKSPDGRGGFSLLDGEFISARSPDPRLEKIARKDKSTLSKGVWIPTPKSRRCYHRVISGVERGGTLRFLTLTSSDESPDSCQKSFRVLYMRLKRRNLIKGYIKVPNLSKNGKQHLHVLFRGSYIEQQLLSHWWQEIHQAKVVDIKIVRRGTDPKKLASEMASYMAKNNAFRYSWSWGWVWRGFAGDWAKLKKLVKLTYGEITGKALQVLLLSWRMWLKGTWQPDFSFLSEPGTT